MEQLLNEIRVSYLDAEINAVLASIPQEAEDATARVHFNQAEEPFLVLDTQLIYPRLPIHHDVRVPEPPASYAQIIKGFVNSLTEYLPATFRGLTYYFDPAEILKPCFFRLYKVEESVYLYHLRIDLAQRPFEGEVLERGTNDFTAAYQSRRLYLESELLPLDAVMWELGRVRAFKIRQLVSNTWIGETGRGYLVRGIWMDTGLSKFFSKLFLPEGAKIYPFYPLFCKYKTICASVPGPWPNARRRILPLLHRAIGLLGPEMERIQSALKAGDFSETMPAFIELKARVPPSWREVLQGLRTEAYLNERDMKEYSLATPNKQA